MAALVTGLWVLLAAALLALLGRRWPRLAALGGALGLAVGGVWIASAALQQLLDPAPMAQRWPLGLPGGELALALDPLSAWFLALVGALAVPVALAGLAVAPRGEGARPVPGPAAWAWLNLLAAAVTVLLCARNAVLFLLAWEAITLFSFLLLTARHEQPDARRAALRFLIAAQIGGACLVLALLLLAAGGDLGFDALAAAATRAGPGRRAAVFALGLVGFGTKAGLLPLHSWLPRAYPEVDSHVAAFFSGAMAKAGIYGLLRLLWLLPTDRAACGLTLALLGAATALAGIAFALGQRSLRRGLAWSSIENLGFITAGVGLWLLAEHAREPAIAWAALAGALLHTVHHGVVKSLLFVAAGSVEDATGRTAIDDLGGLLPRMPGTGAAFLTGAAALASLPPLSGLVGEWLVLCAGVRAVAVLPRTMAVPVVLVLLGLLVAAGLAAAALVRLFAVVFLGQCRTTAAAAAGEAPFLRQLSVLVLAGVSLALGLFPGLFVQQVAPVTAQLCGGAGPAPLLLDAVFPLARVGRLAAVMAVLVLVLAWLRQRLTRGAPARVTTWGCGYARPSARAQYTGASFSASLLRALRHLVRTRVTSQLPTTVFPVTVRQVVEVPDRIEASVWEPLFLAIGRRLDGVRRLQDGRLERYLFQLVACLVAGLLWALWWGWSER